MDANRARDLIDGVPEFKRFRLVDELEEASIELAKKYPECVERRRIGESSEGRPINALIIGEGDRTAFLYGFTHPNEPIGSLTIDYLASRLATSVDLRKRLGYKFILAKAIDVDGAKLNEGWFSGPFDLLTYAENYYRPPPNEQAEWTFPIDYRTLHWKKPIPETRAIKKIVDEFKPEFTYILHNADFFGVYYYLSHALPSAYVDLKSIPISEGLPLHRGEPPDEPYLRTLHEGIYHDYGVSDEYEFLLKTLGCDPATKINYGTDCYEYIRLMYDGFCLTCELPHFFDKRIADTTPTMFKRRDLTLESLKIEAETHDFVNRIFEESRDSLNHDSRVFRSITYYLDRRANLEETTRIFVESPEFDRPSTEAEAFDLTVLKKFSQMPALGMMARALKEAERGTKRHKLGLMGDEVRSRLHNMNRDIMKESEARAIPIRTLVRIQLQSALVCMRHLFSTQVC